MIKSIEALETIKKIFMMNRGSIDFYKREIEPIIESIEKDLDVLEIIRKYPHRSLGAIQNYIEAAKLHGWVIDEKSLDSNYIDLTVDEFNKVKEWLER